MGILSGILSSLKEAVNQFVNAIATELNGIFGSPIVLSLAMFMIAYTIYGPAWNVLWQNPLSLFTSHPVLSGLLINVAITLVSLASERVAYNLGRLVGFVSVVLFVTALINVAWTNAITAAMSGFLDGALAATTLQMLQAFAVSYVVSQLAAGPDSAFIHGFIDGFFAPLEAAAGAIDSSLAGVWWVLAAGAGALWLLSDKKTTGVRVTMDRTLSARENRNVAYV